MGGGVSLSAAAAQERLSRALEPVDGTRHGGPEADLAALNRAAERIGLAKLSKMSKVLGGDNRSYVPSDKPRPGPFNIRDSTIYRCERIVDPQKGQGYQVVLVDREGRTVNQIVFGDQARDFDDWHHAMKGIQKNPALHHLYRQFLHARLPNMLKAKTQKRAADRRGAPAAAAPPSTKQDDDEW
jgi:hypothetical protein